MISSSTRVAGPFSGTGIQTVFPFSFKVFQASDVLVIQTDLTGLETTQTLTSQYTVSLNSNQDTSPGGTVTMLTAPPSGYLLTLSSQVQALQSTNLTNAGNFYPQVVNNALDYLTVLVQQLYVQVNLAVRVNISSGISPSVMAGYIVALYNNLANLIAVNSNASNINAAVANSSNINAAVSNSSNINAVVADTTNINAVASDLTNINTVASNISSVNTNTANITAIQNAATNAATATTQAGIATTQAGIATTQATNASTSATNTAALLASFRSAFLGSFASDSAAVAFATANSITLSNGIMYENNSTSPEKFRIYNGSAWQDYDSSAQTSQSAAALSATNAGASATAAANSATSAATSATNAATSATNAATSATSAAAQLTLFKDIFYGPYATNPTTRPDSTAMQAGDLYYNTASKALQVYNGTSWGAAGVVFNPIQQSFSGTGSQTTFTLSQAPGVVAALLVSIGGVNQTAGVDYTLSGTTLTFTTAPVAGTNNINTVNFGVAGTIGVPANNSVTYSALDSNLQSKFAMKNRIINGAMVIDQRNSGASVTPTGSGTYTVDRFYLFNTQASKLSIQQNAGSVTPPICFSNYAGITSLSAFTPASTDYFGYSQSIEGFNTADLNWGTTNAKPVTFSFWVYSSLTGTFGGFFKNNAGNRFYIYSYSIPVANTWTQISVTIPGDTAGTWNTTNGIGLAVTWGLGAGSTYTGGSASWGGTFYNQPTGSVNLVSTNGATFYITGVQLEVGSSATGFEYRQYGQELALCQRYFQVPLNAAARFATGFIWATNSAFAQVPLKVSMRTAPTVTFNGSFYGLDAAGIGRGMTAGTEYTSTEEIAYSFSSGFNQVAGNGTCLGLSSSGYIWASAEL